MAKRQTRREIGAAIAEFGPALFVFFFIILFPLINMIALGTGAGTVYLISKQCASKAGQSTTFQNALESATNAALELESGGFGKFAGLVPVGGFNNSGMDLYITDTNISTNQSTRYGPNTPSVPPPSNPDEHLYSYDAVVTFDVGPMVNLHSVPWIGNVPGVGVPARMSYTASSNVEHPEGLLSLVAETGGGVGPSNGGPIDGGPIGGPPPRDDDSRTSSFR